ncbi:OLC1v1013041C1 [Oldenlandia corymbosa var. corymbosa]|uniref:OLC1v1013041C1 n=1 Tax=Oldenlandia corymbosa var. corymbosa TaxID=529605 RepID=A0AAV1DXG3_OLDCO|nr:OLC1v1013041C1 [Oldenlandia corymbosa var. corymbosa]
MKSSSSTQIAPMESSPVTHNDYDMIIGTIPLKFNQLVDSNSIVVDDAGVFNHKNDEGFNDNDDDPKLLSSGEDEGMDDCYDSVNGVRKFSAEEWSLVDSYSFIGGIEDENTNQLQDNTKEISTGDFQMVAKNDEDVPVGLTATYFYEMFLDVICEWKEKENGEDFRCKEGVVDIMVARSKLLLKAREIYTIEAYLLFEEQFLKGISLKLSILPSATDEIIYEVYRDDSDMFKHRVSYNPETHSISCTCKKYYENKSAQKACEEALKIATNNVIAQVGPIFNNNAADGGSNNDGNVRNPTKREGTRCK